jgi:hypothetical protein
MEIKLQVPGAMRDFQHGVAGLRGDVIERGARPLTPLPK